MGKAKRKNGKKRDRSLPVAVEPPRQRLSPVSYTPFLSSFASQMIAERYHLPPQRQIYRASVTVALQSYEEGARKAIRRVPSGYRRALTV